MLIVLINLMKSSNITKEIIFTICSELLENNQKLTGENIKNKLFERFGQSCDNKFIYNSLKDYKNTLLKDFSQSQTEDINDDLIKKTSLILSSLFIDNIFYTTNILNDSAKISYTINESEKVRSQNLELIEELEILKKDLLNQNRLLELLISRLGAPIPNSISNPSNPQNNGN